MVILGGKRLRRCSLKFSCPELSKHKVNKNFQVFIYNGIPESDFVYLVNNLDKLS